MGFADDITRREDAEFLCSAVTCLGGTVGLNRLLDVLDRHQRGDVLALASYMERGRTIAAPGMPAGASASAGAAPSGAMETLKSIVCNPLFQGALSVAAQLHPVARAVSAASSLACGAAGATGPLIAALGDAYASHRRSSAGALPAPVTVLMGQARRLGVLPGADPVPAQLPQRVAALRGSEVGARVLASPDARRALPLPPIAGMNQDAAIGTWLIAAAAAAPASARMSPESTEPATDLSVEDATALLGAS